MKSVLIYTSFVLAIVPDVNLDQAKTYLPLQKRRAKCDAVQLMKQKLMGVKVIYAV